MNDYLEFHNNFFYTTILNLKLWFCSWVTLCFHIQFFHITTLFKFKSNSFFSWHFNSQELAKIKTIIKKTRYLCLMALNSYINVFTYLFSFSISTCSQFQAFDFCYKLKIYIIRRIEK